MIYVFGFLLAAALGLIPANIARDKGYDFGLWWLYGTMLFLIAFIHACVLQNKNAQVLNQQNAVYPGSTSPVSNESVVEELKKYKELMDEGVITEEEFTAKKEQLLKLM